MGALRLTLRSLTRTPVYAATAILSLALGIGATTAIFSMIDGVLLASLPVSNPDTLAFIYQTGPLSGSISTSEPGGPAFSYRMFREMQAQQTGFTGLAGSYAIAASAAYHSEAENVRAQLVSGNYFQVLGVGAALGRVFDGNDDQHLSGDRLVVLSHAYWVSRFAGDPGVLNQPLVVNGRTMTIVGVAQTGFTSEMPGNAPELFIPITMKKEMTPDWDGMNDRRDYWVTMFGRMNPGETLAQAQTAINVSYLPQLRQDIALLNKVSAPKLKEWQAKHLELRPGRYGRGQLRAVSEQPLLLLLAMTALVLLIACANVANLQLARAAARTRETAVRLALGASRQQLVGRLLLESLVIAIAGACIGLGVAYVTERAILVSLPPRMLGSLPLQAGLDGRMLLVALLLGAVASVLFGLYPALQASRADLALAMREQNGQATGSRAAGTFRKGLVVLQTAISLLLLISAGLFGKTLVNLTRVELGMRPDHLLTFSLTPKLNGYDDARTSQLYTDLRDRLAALPGVTSATTARVAAIAGSSSSSNFTVEGFTPKSDGDDGSNYNEVGPDYFRTMGIPLVRGREFGVSDTAAAPKVAVVNEAFVRHFFPDHHDPIGAGTMRGSDTRIRYDTVIVGVVKDSVYSNLRQPPVPVYYSVAAQARQQRNLSFYVRTNTDPRLAIGAVRAAVAALDPNLPLVNLRTMEDQIDTNVASERLLSRLTGTFAGLATLLAAIGLYGVLSFNVARRTREIGIRMALGASRQSVRRLVAIDVGIIMGIGLTAGLAGAALAGRLIQAVLFRTAPFDPWVFGGAALILTLIAIAAAYLPARRATGVDPMIALRCE